MPSTPPLPEPKPVPPALTCIHGGLFPAPLLDTEGQWDQNEGQGSWELWVPLPLRLFMGYQSQAHPTFSASHRSPCAC